MPTSEPTPATFEQPAVVVVDAVHSATPTLRQTYEAVVEADYRVQVTKFVVVQPFWQYIVRPNGTGLVGNANILGVHMEVTF